MAATGTHQPPYDSRSHPSLPTLSTRRRAARVLLAALAAVSWAFAAMAAVAALGLHLLQADRASSLGSMTAAVVALAVGGKVTPSGDVNVFGISPGGAAAGIDLIPLGVALVGALTLSWVFLRSLRRAAAVTAGELAARVGCTVAVFLAVLAGLAWAGHDTITIDGASLSGYGGGDGGGLLDDLPGLGDLGDTGGLTEGLTDLIGAKASVGFQVELAASLLRGLVWVLLVLLIALLASRRTPLPGGWEALHGRVRPAVSALSTVLVLAVVAGALAGAVAAVTGDEPGRIIGGVLLGAPNGVWLAVPLGLFVPFDGAVSGSLAGVLPAPMDELLTGGPERAVTVGGLAELDSRVWLLPVAAALMMLTAGVLSAARTPVGGGVRAGRLALATAVRLGLATAVALPLLSWLTGVRVDANLSVFGFNAVDAGLTLDGRLPMALLLGAGWGAAAGFLGSLLASVFGAAGRRATDEARSALAPLPGPVLRGADAAPQAGSASQEPGPYRPSPVYRPELAEPEPFNPYREQPAQDGAGPAPPPVQPNSSNPSNPYRDEFNPYRQRP